MRLPGYYSSGQFARMANVSLRTIRYYDQQNILKPSFVNDSGARFYTDADFARLQQILLLKYLGFSLNDIREMTIKDMDYHFMLNSLKMQKKLIQDKIEQMQLVENAINNTTEAIEQNREINWSQMLDLIHLTGMENSMKSQYQISLPASACTRSIPQTRRGGFPGFMTSAKLENARIFWNLAVEMAHSGRKIERSFRIISGLSSLTFPMA